MPNGSRTLLFRRHPLGWNSWYDTYWEPVWVQIVLGSWLLSEQQPAWPVAMRFLLRIRRRHPAGSGQTFLTQDVRERCIDSNTDGKEMGGPHMLRHREGRVKSERAESNGPMRGGCRKCSRARRLGDSNLLDGLLVPYHVVHGGRETKTTKIP